MKSKVLLCVPVFDNPGTIKEVVSNLLAKSNNDILVVDDGSAQPVANLFLAEPRLFHLRTEINQGKGRAIQLAFTWAVHNGYTHVLTSDADGQHPVEDTLKILNASIKNPWALIIGNRKMIGKEIPKISKFGKKFSNFWVKYQTDHKVLDSQSGLRAYPLFHVQNMKFFTARYDFEIEVLIRLIWKKVPVIEEDVNVIYHAKDIRVSHFRKFWDNVRITFLNIILIVISLLKGPNSSIRLAAALALGVFIGCLPIYGLHTLLAFLVSFLFKLNLVALIAGTQVSFAPFLAILIPASFRIGKYYTGYSQTSQFILGSVLLGVFLGLTTFAISLLLLVRDSDLHPARPWRGEQRGGRLGNGFLKFLLKHAGLRSAYGCVMIFVVPYFYFFVPKARKASNEFWKVVQPSSNYFARQALILRHMYRYATILLDSLYMNIHGRESFTLESLGYDNLKEILAEKKGLLLINAHVGAWELSAAALRRHDQMQNLNVVRFEGEGLTFTKLQKTTQDFQSLASNKGELPILEIRSALSGGEIVSMMADRPIRQPELYKFMNKLVLIDPTPFRIALACGSPVMFAFGFRERFKQYTFHVGELPLLENTEKDAQMDALMQSFVNKLEEFIKIHPNQWFNWFRFSPTLVQDIFSFKYQAR